MEHGPVRKLSGDAVSNYKLGREMESDNLPVVQMNTSLSDNGFVIEIGWNPLSCHDGLLLVLIGGAENWPAISRWDPARGGLNHLKGEENWVVHALALLLLQVHELSTFNFYRVWQAQQWCKQLHLIQVAVSFGGFIDHIISGSKTTFGCGSHSPKSSEAKDTMIPPSNIASSIPIKRVEANDEWTRQEGEQAFKYRACDIQLYLAQVPIFSKTSVGETTLTPLMQDIAMPQFLKTNRISDINLWMSMNDSRSSTHYDPYHNLLCVVAGEKKVTLWPPSAAPYLYPLPINGEASNHSGVDFVQPDYNVHPLFKKALCVAKVVVLHPGDALFIPEGWYHQVDNSGVTIAVNFWWPSKVSLALGTHMDAYYLRRVIVSLVDHEKERMLGDEIENSAHQRKSQQPLPRTDPGNLPSDKHLLDQCPKNPLESNGKSPEGDIPGGCDVNREKLHQKIGEPEAFVTLAPPNQSSSRTDSLDEHGILAQETQSCIIPSEEESCNLGIRAVSNIPRFRHDHGEKHLQSVEQSQVLNSEDVHKTQFIETVAAAHSGLNLQVKQILKLEDLTALESYNLRCLMASLSGKATGSTDDASRTLHSARQAATCCNDLGFVDAYQDNSKEILQDGILMQPQEDPITRVFSALTAPSLQRILLVMVNQFPRTLQTLIMTSLSPTAAEVLTRKFEEVDASTENLSQAVFYEQFYSAFDNPKAVMGTLLDGKEAFAAQALHNVMTQFLGLPVALPTDDIVLSVNHQTNF